MLFNIAIKISTPTNQQALLDLRYKTSIYSSKNKKVIYFKKFNSQTMQSQIKKAIYYVGREVQIENINGRQSCIISIMNNNLD